MVNQANRVIGIYLNQAGYRPKDKKVALTLSRCTKFDVYSSSGELIMQGSLLQNNSEADKNSGDILKAADFSELRAKGSYYIKSGDFASPCFQIDESVYHSLSADLIKLFYYQRCGGVGIDSAIVGDCFAHPACHMGKAHYYNPQDAIYGSEVVDVSGGWHDAGDYGRYVTPAAKAIADLLLTYEHFPAVNQLNFGCPHSLLDEVRYELEWMLKMQNPKTGGVYHKVTTQIHANIAILPEDDDAKLFLAPVSAPATGDFAAVMAYAARIYQSADPMFAQTCLASARSAWSWLLEHPEINGYEDPAFFRTGKYNDANSKDERFWAAVELYRATLEEQYLDYLKGNPVPNYGLGWADIGTYAVMSYLTNPCVSQQSALYQEMLAKLLHDADNMLNIWRHDGYKSAVHKYVWGSNMDVANCAMLLLFANRLKPNPEYVEAAMDHLHYLMGRNPMGLSYVTGNGEIHAEHPHHRPSIIKKVPVPGMLVGGPNADITKIERDPASKLIKEGTPPTKCYMDMYESYALNEICIYWNSPLVYVLGFLFDS